MLNPNYGFKWVKAFIESDGTNYTLTSADESLGNSTISGTDFVLDDGLFAIDYMADYHLVENDGSTKTLGKSLKVSDTEQSIALLPQKHFDYCTLYILMKVMN